MTSGKNKTLFNVAKNVAKSVKRLEEKNNKSNSTLSEDLPKEPLSKAVPKEPLPSYAAEDKALFTVVSSFKRVGVKEDLPVVSEIKEEVLVDNKIIEEKEEVRVEPPSSDNSDLINELINIVSDFKEEIDNDIRKTRQNLGADIAFVEQRQKLHKETYKIDVVSQIKEEVLEEVLSDVQRILLGDVEHNIKRLEEKIDIIRDSYSSYRQTLNEGLLNIPPDVKNSDPLTPLDQKFITLEKFEEHYKLFVNRIQTQLATLGGGGSIELQYLEDVNVGIATNITAYDGYYLQVDLNQTGNDANKKFKFAPLAVAGVTTFSGTATFNDDVSFIGNTSNAKWDSSTNDLILYDDTRLEFGSNKDFEIWHGGAHTFMKNTGGDLRIRGNKILLKREDGSERYLEANVNADVSLFYNGVPKFTTTLEGAGISGLTTTTSLSVTGVSTFAGNIDVNASSDVSGLSTFRNGVNLSGLLHTNDDVNFTGDAYNLSWDKSTNSLEFSDNAKATFGAGNDLEIHSDGTTGVVGGAVSFTSDVTVGTSQAVGVVLTSPNGTKYRLVVANDGTLSTSAV